MREGGVQALDLLAGRGRRTGSVVRQALAAIEAELDSVMESERTDPAVLTPVLSTVEDLFAENGLTVDEFAEAGLDPDQAAAVLLDRGRRLLVTAGLSEAELYLVERAVAGCCRAILSEPELLPGREYAFQRSVLADLSELMVQLQDQGEQLPRRVVDAITAFLQPAGETQWPVLVGRVPPLADQYQPRAALRQAMSAVGLGGTMVLTQERAGPGGVGKTQLAAGYTRDLLETSAVELVVWVTAASRDAIVTAYASALAAIHPGTPGRGEGPEADAQRLLSWLASAERQWLVVLDDLSSAQDMQGLWPTGAAGRVVVTTRSRDRALTEQGRQALPVGLFTEAEALAYLSGKLHDNQLAQAAELAADLRHIPLALAQAASVIANNQIDCAAYRARVADQHNRLVALFPPDALADDYSRTLATTWLSSLDTANKLHPSGLAGRLLRITALLDANGIPADLFASPAILGHLGDYEPDTRAEVDAADAQTGLQNLRRVSLADIDPPAPDGTGGVIRVHDMVQRASRETTPIEQLAADACACAEGLLAIWPEQDYQPTTAPQTAALRSNTSNLRQHAGGHLWLELAAYAVLFRHGRSLHAGGLYHLNIDHCADLHTQAITHLGPQHPDTLISQNNLASAYQVAGRVGEAIPLFEQALTDRVAVLGEQHPDTLSGRNNLASAYQVAGRVGEAIPLFEQNLTDRVAVLGEQHPDTLTTRNNLALAYQDAGRVGEAIPLFEQALTDRVAVLGEQHPDTLSGRNNLASAYQVAGRVDEAIPLFEQTLTDLVAVLGEQHPNTLISRNNLASAYRAAGRVGEAIPLFEQALTDLVAVLGEQHPDTLISRNNLALAYRAAGRTDVADP